LAYIGDKGYSSDPSTALDANFAIWQLSGATRAAHTSNITTEIKDNAKTAPTAPAGASSVHDAVSAGDVTLTLDEWAAIGEKVAILNATDHFYGRGELTITNTSDKSLTLYFPTGTLFDGSEARFQVMGSYAEDITVNNPKLPSTATGESLPFAALVLVALTLVVLGVSTRKAFAN
jgi:hypothetical protein